MNSRVEKYAHIEEEVEMPSRVIKNQNLYNDLSVPEMSRMKPDDNVKVIETSSNRIDLDKIKKYIESSNEEEKTIKNVVVHDTNEVPQKNIFEDEKIYDINSVLEIAREKKESYYEDEKHKKLRDTQYDILSKIKVYDEEEPQEEKKEEIELNTDEKTLIDLINTVTKNKTDLLDELRKGSENTIVTSPINEEVNDETIKKAIEESKEPIEERFEITREIKFKKEEKFEEPEYQIEEKTVQEKILEQTKENKKEDTLELKEVDNDENLVKNLDKSFYTNSMTFSKDDFEGFEELEKTVKKNNSMVKLSIILLSLLAVATIFVVLKYVLNLF